MTWESVLDIKWTDCLVMFCRMMFAGIVCTIVDAAMPEIKKLTLGVAAFEPMEVLIH